MRNPSNFSFANLPLNNIPASTFNLDNRHTTTCKADYLIPIYLEEVLPGDIFELKTSLVAKILTLKTQIFDNIECEVLFFYDRNQNLWDNWRKMCGERANPNSSIDYEVPQVLITNEPGPNNLEGYFGLPQKAVYPDTVSALPFRMYFKVFNEWFRPEDYMDSLTYNTNDSIQGSSDFFLTKRCKMHDYFTSGLPEPQKNSDSVTVPLGTSAPVFGNGISVGLTDGLGEDANIFGMANDYTSGGQQGLFPIDQVIAQPVGTSWTSGMMAGQVGIGIMTKEQIDYNNLEDEDTGMYVDLENANSATICQLREAFQVQKFYERDQRCGTRYHEYILAHWGVSIMDTYRSVYLGSAKTMMNMMPVVQQSQSDTTPQGNLTSNGLAVIKGKQVFKKYFDDYGWIMGLLCFRGDLSYMQGLHRKWSRKDRFDFAYPEFAHLCEQPIYLKEIYKQLPATGQDDDVFAYNERYSEYRYGASYKTGEFNSEYGTLDEWHVAEDYGSKPEMNATFLLSNLNQGLERACEAGENYLIYVDILNSVRATRKLPTWSIPGLIDHM